MVTFKTVIRKSVFCLSISIHSVKDYMVKNEYLVKLLYKNKPKDCIILCLSALRLCKTFLRLYNLKILRRSLSKLTLSYLSSRICPSTVNPSTQILRHCEQVSREKEGHCTELQQCRFLICCKHFLKRKRTYINSKRLRIGV